MDVAYVSGEIVTIQEFHASDVLCNITATKKNHKAEWKAQTCRKACTIMEVFLKNTGHRVHLFKMDV